MIEPADRDLYDDAPVVLYLHGGGYFFCSPRTHRPITIGLATHARARVCDPDYRLAPEPPFPAPVEDALLTYRTLLAQGVAASRIVVAGDSAGGGLALALLWPCVMRQTRCRRARCCIRRGRILPPPAKA